MLSVWRVMSFCFRHWDPFSWCVEYRCCQCDMLCLFVTGIKTCLLDVLSTDAVSVRCYVFFFQALRPICLMCWVQMLSVRRVMSFCFRHLDLLTWLVEYRCCQCDELCPFVSVIETCLLGLLSTDAVSVMCCVFFVSGIETCLLDVLSTDAVSVACYVFLFQALRPVCLICLVQMLSVWCVMSFCFRHWNPFAWRVEYRCCQCDLSNVFSFFGHWDLFAWCVECRCCQCDVMSFCFRHWDPSAWCVEYRCCQWICSFSGESRHSL